MWCAHYNVIKVIKELIILSKHIVCVDVCIYNMINISKRQKKKKVGFFLREYILYMFGGNIVKFVSD